MINIDKVSKSYGKDQVLDEVGLSIDKGNLQLLLVQMVLENLHFCP